MRQAIAYAIDRKRVNEIASRGTGFEGHGLLPEFYKAFYSEPADDYPLDVAKASQMLDAAGWTKGEGGVREKGGTKLSFDLFVRTESPNNIQAARLVREMTKPIGVDFKVKVVSVDKLTEITTREVDGKMAPDFDTFIWGWGGDPYDPSLLLNLLTTKAIGASSDAFYSNPEYDRLYDQQSGEFDEGTRKELVEPDDRAQPARPALHRAHRRPDAAGLPHRQGVGRHARLPRARRRHHLRPGHRRHLRVDGAADRGEPRAAVTAAAAG